MKATVWLSKDPVMRKLIEEHGELEEHAWDKSEENLFADLVESVINQQLSVKAAATIFGRFKDVFEDEGFPKAETVLEVKDQVLRDCGISFSKVSYIKGISEAVVKKNIDLENLSKLEDEVVVKELTKLKGIGQWSAEMFLMFSLRRPDVFSVGDLGLRTAVAKLYNADREDLKKIEKISLKWKPFRTTASRYLWKSLSA